MLATQFVQRFHHAQRIELLAVDGHAIAFRKIQGGVFSFGRGVFRRDAQFVHGFVFRRGGIQPRVFEDAGLEGYVQKIAIHRIRLLGAGFDGNALLLAVLDHLGATGKLGAKSGVAPRSDDAQLRGQSGGGQLKANLVVALPSGAVGDGAGLFAVRDLDHALCNQGPGDAGAQEVLVLVNRARLHHGEDEVAREFVLKVVDVNLGRAGFEGLLFQALEFLLLADVGAKGDHFGAIFFLDPGKKDRGIQAARVGQHNFHGAN